MKSKDFIEQRSYQTSDLAEALRISPQKAREYVSRLLLAGLVKPYQEEHSDDWADEVVHGEHLANTDNDNPRFKFIYVGIIEIDGHIIKCYPKYIKRDPTIEDMRFVLNAAERYNTEYTSLEISPVNNRGGFSNQLALALALLRDYLTYGLYSNQREELTHHGQGDIDWEVTINTTMPIIRDNRPYYFDYYTSDIRQDDTDYITRLHACVISECSRHLHECELDEILQLETPTPYQGERNSFGTDEFIIQRLTKEMNIQFINQKQNVLRNLLAWIENTSFSSDSSCIRMFGTNSFHTLWEAMCSDVFASQFKNTLNSLGLDLHSDFKGKNTLESLIKKPQWQSSTGGEPHLSPQTLRPDYIRIVKHNGHTHFVILDAKYYDIELDAEHVSGQPGVEDVCKQYLYLMAYSNFIQSHNITPINAFISPSDDSHSTVVGTASMPLSVLEKLPSIQVVKISAARVFNNYINRTHLSLEKEVPDLFLSEQ